MNPVTPIRNYLSGTIWPAVPAPAGATTLALLFQLEQSQWLSAEQLAQRQLEQLKLIVAHAYATTPLYRASWMGRFDPAAPFDWRVFNGLPLLSRRSLQSGFDAAQSSSVPAAHGPVAESRTSGSSGTPLRLRSTGLCQVFWNAITLRDHLWHRRDFSGKLAAVRASPPGDSDNWGTATLGVIDTGPLVLRSIRAGSRDLPAWLEKEQPDYLVTYPSILRELLNPTRRGPIRFRQLKQVRTFGEMLPEDLRAACADTWNAPLVDMYSAEETGYIALQCPVSGCYHAQAENVLVEVLDENGAPCAPGEIGRIVVTPFHNFAMPLIRYVIGDYAQVGKPCPCGRGLPVLERIVGRVNNMLITASGDRFWPYFGMRTFKEIDAILQHQFVQKEFGLVEARLVTAGPLGAALEEKLCSHMQSVLPEGIRVKIVYCDEIRRGAGGKYEDFITEVGAPTS